MIVQLCKYTKILYAVYLKEVNIAPCELYLYKTNKNKDKIKMIKCL